MWEIRYQPLDGSPSSVLGQVTDPEMAKMLCHHAEAQRGDQFGFAWHQLPDGKAWVSDSTSGTYLITEV